MSNLQEVQRMLKRAIGHLERANVDLVEVTAVQASRANLEKFLACWNGQPSVYVSNPSSVLRTVANALEPINSQQTRSACADVVEAATQDGVTCEVVGSSDI
jgi:hypothetical protein